MGLEVRSITANRLERYLDKPSRDFRKADIIKYIEENDIRMLNFRYVGGDGKLKVLNFVLNDKQYLEQLLSTGERVDGSSLFSHIDTSSSDLYVIPRYRSAFLNPFSDTPTIDILCSFYSSEGKPLNISPENVVKKAHNYLKETTGMTLEALGELEFYLFSPLDKIYPITQQKGYHESHPFSKWENIRLEAMKYICEAGGKIKYGHAEVGNIIQNNEEMVQHEIEFLPVPIEESADQLVVAKWILREVAYKHGLTISFAPKIMAGHAGNGFHIHTRLVRNNRNMMVDNDRLNPTAMKLIAGYLELSPSLTAFGNTVPTSYLRLVSNQEVPTKICWGEKNRNALVRVPLGWLGVENMIKDANPDEPDFEDNSMSKQTIELRSPDGSANIHYLLAGMAVAARYGLQNKKSLEIAKRRKVDKCPEKERTDKDQLPSSCYEAAEMLLRDRKIYEEGGVFPPELIDGTIKNLKKYNDKDLSNKYPVDSEEIRKLVDKFIHCG